MTEDARAPRLSIAVVQGGPSSEAEVSRASATSIARALGASGHRVVRLELDAFLADSLRTGGYDVVFPACHGAVGEDGALQGLLEVMDLPYVGSGVLASALAMNKRVAKVLFANAGLPIAPGLTLPRPGRGSVGGEAARAAARVLRELGDRVVVKPCSSGSAIGVARFGESGADERAIADALEAAWQVDAAALVERFVPGREITCGVLDAGAAPGREGEAHAERAAPLALPPTEIRSPKDAFYTYQARYAPGRSEHLCPAPLDEAVTQRVQEVAVDAHRALGCRDLCRADFVVGEAGVTLLEVNTLPGFTDTSLFPEAAAVAGVAMPELCHRLALAAFRRGPPRRNAPIPLPA